ncbi:MAG: hypothetical protein JNN07_00955 [Verrucomicrobiales bacterium]|nr:hypothetical protein [Verrucomicrobiales bacterium]
MNDEPAGPPEPDSNPKPPQPRWTDEDHPGIDYQKKRSHLRSVALVIAALLGAVLVGLALLFGACALIP